MYQFALIMFVLMFAIAPSLNAHSAYLDSAWLTDQYLQAVERAAVPTAEKQYPGLVSISPGNQALQRKTIGGDEYILFVTWKGDVSYFPKEGKYNTGSWPNIWVTASPQLHERFHALEPADTNMRLLQLLGLPPNAVYNYFVELWVRPQDLLRPCPDNEITDTECNLCFTHYTATNGKDSLDTAWVKWIDETRISRYYACDPLQKYPWTALGYTYDWNLQNARHIGLSEFVIRKNATVYIKQIRTTGEYLESSQ